MAFSCRLTREFQHLACPGQSVLGRTYTCRASAKDQRQTVARAEHAAFVGSGVDAPAARTKFPEALRALVPEPSCVRWCSAANMTVVMQVHRRGNLFLVMVDADWDCERNNEPWPLKSRGALRGGTHPPGDKIETVVKVEPPRTCPGLNGKVIVTVYITSPGMRSEAQWRKQDLWAIDSNRSAAAWAYIHASRAAAVDAAKTARGLCPDESRCVPQWHITDTRNNRPNDPLPTKKGTPSIKRTKAGKPRTFTYVMEFGYDCVWRQPANRRIRGPEFRDDAGGTDGADRSGLGELTPDAPGGPPRYDPFSDARAAYDPSLKPTSATSDPTVSDILGRAVWKQERQPHIFP